MAGYHVQLFTETPDVKVSELYHLAKALEINGRHCADAWGLVPPAIDVGSDRSKLVTGSHPIVFMDEGADPTTLADHYYDPLRQGPAARVYVDKASGFHTGHQSVSESAGHELVEMLVNPRLDIWTHAPGRPEDVQVSYENADPVQTHYVVESNGAEWQVANFVTPAWFRSDLAGDKAKDFLFAGGTFDYSGELTRAGQVGKRGYLILREWTQVVGKAGYWRRYLTDIGGKQPRESAAKAHPWARTARIMEGTYD